MCKKQKKSNANSKRKRQHQLRVPQTKLQHKGDFFVPKGQKAEIRGQRQEIEEEEGEGSKGEGSKGEGKGDLSWREMGQRTSSDGEETDRHIGKWWFIKGKMGNPVLG
jgi:hypothetical protein